MHRLALLALVGVVLAALVGLAEGASLAARHVGVLPVVALLAAAPLTLFGALFAGCRSPGALQPVRVRRDRHIDPH